MKALEPYYNAIRATAHQISTHNERQKFLKVIYEGFYKIYNKKAADRLGVGLHAAGNRALHGRERGLALPKHFGKALIDKGVEISIPRPGPAPYLRTAGAFSRPAAKARLQI